jgi:hypothetical protein
MIPGLQSSAFSPRAEGRNTEGRCGWGAEKGRPPRRLPQYRPAGFLSAQGQRHRDGLLSRGAMAVPTWCAAETGGG